MAWYAFEQNNSGGYYMINNVVSVYVMVEESTAKKAIKKARSITKNHRKYCDCCGKRWDFNEYEVLDGRPSDFEHPAILYFSNGERSNILGTYAEAEEAQIAKVEVNIRNDAKYLLSHFTPRHPNCRTVPMVLE